MIAPERLPAFVTTDQVAYLIGMSVPLFRQRREAMIEDLGFPEPLAHVHRPMRWRADQVLAWVEAQGRPRAFEPPPRPQGPNVVLIEKARHA